MARLRGRLSAEQRARVAEATRALVPAGVRVAVVDDDVDLFVLRPDGEATAGDAVTCSLEAIL